jgi:hypothetical protein
VVSKLLGHKDVATTYKIYIHLIPEEMDEAVDAVGKVMMATVCRLRMSLVSDLPDEAAGAFTRG